MRRVAPGFTAYLCVGRYAGFSARKDGPAYILTLGWVSVGVLLFDLEIMMVTVAQILEDTDGASQGV